LATAGTAFAQTVEENSEAIIESPGAETTTTTAAAVQTTAQAVFNNATAAATQFTGSINSAETSLPVPTPSELADTVLGSAEAGAANVVEQVTEQVTANPVVSSFDFSQTYETYLKPNIDWTLEQFNSTCTSVSEKFWSVATPVAEKGQSTWKDISDFVAERSNDVSEFSIVQNPVGTAVATVKYMPAIAGGILFYHGCVNAMSAKTRTQQLAGTAQAAVSVAATYYLPSLIQAHLEGDAGLEALPAIGDTVKLTFLASAVAFAIFQGTRNKIAFENLTVLHRKTTERMDVIGEQIETLQRETKRIILDEVQKLLIEYERHQQALNATAVPVEAIKV